MAEASRQERSVIERHLQSAIMAIVLAVVMWIGNTVVQVDKRTAVIEEAVAALKRQSEQWYPSSAALRDQAEMARRLERLEGRIDRLEHNRNAN